MSVLELITANGFKTTENKLRLLSINEVRKILGIRYDTVKRLIESGEIEIILIERKIKIPMINLENYINKKSRKINNNDMLHSKQNKILKNKDPKICSIINKYI